MSVINNLSISSASLPILITSLSFSCESSCMSVFIWNAGVEFEGSRVIIH